MKKLHQGKLIIFRENQVWNSKKEQPYLWTNYDWIKREQINSENSKWQRGKK